MSLQFILGRSYADHESFIVDRIANLLRNQLDHSENRIFYLVPDHMKFESELSVLQKLHQHPSFQDRAYLGMIQLQVLSFKRLAWYLLQDQAIFQARQLSDSGSAMLIQKILIEKSDQLRVYKGQVYQQGFIHRLRDLLKEFRQGGYSVDLLLDIVENLEKEKKEKNLRKKLSEISMIYEAYSEEISKYFVEEAEIMDALIEYFKAGRGQDTHIFVNHFSDFSSQEERLLEVMMKESQGLSLSLVLDQPYSKACPKQVSVFYQPGKTYFRLYEGAKKNKITIKEDIVLGQEASRPMLNLENHLSQSPLDLLSDSPASEEKVALELWKADSKQAEVMHLAGEINQLVHEKKYRYQDIIILCRQLSDYEAILGPTFARNKISYFIDHSHKMSQHPFAEFLSLLLRTYRYHYRQEDIIHLLKTDLLLDWDPDEKLPKQQDKRRAMVQEKSKGFKARLNILENYVLQFGIDGYEWTQEEDWNYIDSENTIADDTNLEEEEIANALKKKLQNNLDPLFKQWDQAETNEEAARFLYLFLENQQVPEILLAWRDSELESGSLEKSREYEQIWGVFIQILDEFVEILGDSPWSAEIFYEILRTAFEQASYSNVPPAIDQVVVTDFSRLPGKKAKVVFVIGLNDDQLPMKASNNSLLTDRDRSRLNDEFSDHTYLKEYGQVHYAREAYLAYQIFTHATDQLYLSYTAMDWDNKALKASNYLERLSEHFNLAIVEKKTEIDIENENSLTAYFSSQGEAFGQLLSAMRSGIKEGKKPTTTILELYHYFLSQEESSYTYLAQSLTYRNIPKALDKKRARQLYGDDLYLSVSQLENYYLDPFSHFLNYGLRLKERKIMGYTALESGDFFHDSLDLVIDFIIQERISLPDLSNSEIESLVQELSNKLLAQPKYRIFNKKASLQFMGQQLTETVRRMVWAMKEQAKETGFRPFRTELTFGFDQDGIVSKSYPLSDNRFIHLRGKIDRVDRWKIGDNYYYSVIDYKSSARTLKVEEIYYGLSLQLMTYLKVYLEAAQKEEGDQAKAAGAFYSHVHNKYFNLKEDLSDEEIADKKLRDHRLKGLLVEDESLMAELEDRLEEGEGSSFFSMRKKKSGGLSGQSFISLNDLETIFDYSDYLIREAGENILSGDTRLQPIEGKDYTPSISKAYRALSQFDAMLSENNYRFIEKKSLEDMRQLLDQEKEDQ